jgi:flagellar biogenesis protein FliO
MELSEQLMAVVMVLTILGGGLWLLKRKGLVQTSLRRSGQPGVPRLESLNRLALTPQHSLHLIRAGDQTLLIGISPGGCALIESGFSVPPDSSKEIH